MRIGELKVSGQPQEWRTEEAEESRSIKPEILEALRSGWLNFLRGSSLYS